MIEKSLSLISLDQLAISKLNVETNAAKSSMSVLTNMFKSVSGGNGAPSPNEIDLAMAMTDLAACTSIPDNQVDDQQDGKHRGDHDEPAEMQDSERPEDETRVANENSNTTGFSTIDANETIDTTNEHVHNHETHL